MTWQTTLQKEILLLRQDAHVTTYNIFMHQQKWNAIYENDLKSRSAS